MGRKPDAKGGNGDIYFDSNTNTATKFLRNTSTKERRERFIQELRVLETLSKENIPNIVKVLEVHIDEDVPKESFIKMKKYDGSLQDLFDYTKGNGKLTLKLILPIIKALKRLAENNPSIYHRDLKPDNILYLKKDDDYELYLTDFGTCFLKNEDERITPQHIAVGARMFLAPEYEMGRVESVTEKGDIYSIGKIIWCMINGEKDVVFPSNFWFVNEFNLLNKFPNDLDMIGANLIIASCLNLDQEKRCTYDELIALINNIIDEHHNNVDIEKQYGIKLFEERRKIEFTEKLEKNKSLVNNFSITYIKVLEKLNSTYPDFALLKELYSKYRSKSKDGVDYTSKNIEDDSSHNLSYTSFDNVYLHIEYNPASGGQKYASIKIWYVIHSNQKRNNMIIKYNEHEVIVSEYNGTTQMFDEKVMFDFLDNFITDYTSYN